MKLQVLLSVTLSLTTTFLAAQQVNTSLKQYLAIKPKVKYGSTVFTLDRDKIVPGKEEVTVHYVINALPSLKVSIKSALGNATGRKIVAHQVEIRSNAKLENDLTFYFPYNAVTDVNKLWYPLKNGIGKTIKSPGKNNAAIFRSAGKSERLENDLAVPVVVYNRGGDNVGILTDPYFTSVFENENIYWTYAKEVGLEDEVEKRTIIEAFGIIDPDDALSVFYATVLKDVPAGPSWIKDIAMISFDYMSNDGNGWYNDIDSLEKKVAVQDRDKILLTLHGWYDYVGRYCYDQKTRKLNENWKNSVSGKILTLADLHHRIKYAKDKGFRVAFYFADGIISGDQLEDYSPEKAIEGGGWTGPDMVGKTYRRNISCPEYYNFYLDYSTALFNEFAREVDMFVWDETFYIGAGNLGTKHYRSYLDRTFMRLVKEITAGLHKINPKAAFMTSDLIGPINNDYADFADVPPYSLVADGVYQDSRCAPEYWSYTIFPNYRNVAWSCNWWGVSRFDYTIFGVMQYQAPVVFTNGWEDNKGFAEMTEKEKQKFIQLFDYRKTYSTKLKWFTALPPYLTTCEELKE